MIMTEALARYLRLLAVSVIAAMALTPAAQALDEGRLKKLFNLLDGDGNGEITRPEYETGLGLVFFALDGNGDFALTGHEIRLTPEAFDHIAGGDGRIDGLEFFTADVASFEAIDGDNSFLVTFPELLSYIEKYTQ